MEDKYRSKPEEKPVSPQTQAEITDWAVKDTMIGKVSNWIAGAIFFVPVVILWILFYYLATKYGWFIKMTPNVRGVVIIGAVAAPLILGKVFIVKVAPYFDNKIKR